MVKSPFQGSSGSGVITVAVMPKKSRLKLAPLKLTTDETFGQRLARLRKERSMTQVQLAKKTGLTQGLITDYESGKLRLHADLVCRLALALGVSADELLGLKSSRPAAAIEASSGLSLKIVRRMVKVERLPENKQKVILQTIDGFLKGEGITASA
mgnify:CR=1 FL=1